MKEKLPNCMHLWRLMKVSVLQVFMILLSLGMVSAKTSNAQEILNRSVNLKANNSELKLILSEIESQTGVKFIYSTKIKPGKTFSINARNTKLSDVLDKMLRPAAIGYEVMGERILLKSTSKKTSPHTSSAAEDQSTISISKILKSITGSVKDVNGEAIPGVSVLIKGTTKGIYKPDGTYILALQGNPVDNPFTIITELQHESINDRLQANFSAEYDILKDLKSRVPLGGSTNNAREGSFQPTTLNQGCGVGGEATVDGDKNTNSINENYLTYNKTLGGIHNVGLLAGYSFQKTTFESWGGQTQSFITDAVSFWNLGSGSILQAPNSNYSESQLSSYFGRVNYGYKDKYPTRSAFV